MNDNLLAQKVKDIRKTKGFSQQTLAKIAGVSLRTIQRIETENKNPSGDTLKRLSKALGVSPDYLIEWEPNQNPNFLLILAFSPILSIINPFLAVIVPLILWVLKKNSIRGVKTLGAKVLTMQIIWLIVFFIIRTLNYFRLTHIIQNTQSFAGDEWNTFLSDIETQSLLKISFIIINILITFFITFKTYQYNRINSSKLTFKTNPL